MKPITVKELKEACDEQIKKGNGDKVIMISDDDEGNGYHYLWYSFTTMEEFEEPIDLGGNMYEVNFDAHNENIAKKEDTIILG